MNYQAQVLVACLAPFALIAVSCAAIAVQAWWKFR
jgi:hypothetical protein